MEKQFQPHDVHYQAARPQAVLPIGRLVALLCLTLLCGYSVLQKPFNSEASQNNCGIIWSSCGRVADHDLQCARLDVPKDHFVAEEDGTISSEKFSLAITRLVGKNATKSLFVNPGGPGGSGGEFISRRGEQLNKIIGDGYYLLSFDPRGVNQSFPKASCFLNDIDRTVDAALRPTDPWLQSGDFYAYYDNIARACHDVMGENGSYFNTPQTAADMNSILDAIGQEKMLYWGFSYGTTLGQTYAQMFPDRIERLIIDGVSDQKPWYDSELSQVNEFDSTDAVYEGFITECFKSKEACPLAKGFDSAKELKRNLTELIFSLREDPIPVYINASLHGSIRFYDVAWNGIFPSLYRPADWPQLADTLAALLQGNFSVPFLAFSLPENAWSDMYEANMVIEKSDLAPRDQLTRPKKSRLEILSDVAGFGYASYIAGETEASGIFELEAWRYARSHAFIPADRVQTAHPLFILSTSLDPICPLSSARKANAVFEGSILLEQKSMGHCTLSMPSLCTAKHVRRYLDTGKLPEAGTTCEIDEPYFPDPSEQRVLAQNMGNEDDELTEALRALAVDPPWSRSLLRRRRRPAEFGTVI